MFASPHSNMRSIAGLYQDVRADTGMVAASPHRLIEMLFEEFIASCARARGAIRARDVQEKGRAIGRAVRIIEEGLRGGLNMKDGGDLARVLQDLYGYINVRLTQAEFEQRRGCDRRVHGSDPADLRSLARHRAIHCSRRAH